MYYINVTSVVMKMLFSYILKHEY